MSLRYSLTKFLLCVVVCAVPLALLRGYGAEGLWHGLAVGISLSGVILLTNKSNLEVVMDVYAGGIIGAVLATWLPAMTRLDGDPRDAAIPGAIGAIVGGFFAGARARRRGDEADGSNSPSQPPPENDTGA